MPAGRCDRCPHESPCVGEVSPGYCAQWRDGQGPSPAPNVHAARRLLVLGCDYRLEPVGLERGDTCGCNPATRCLLGKGDWGDDPCAITYSNCLVCVSH